MVKLLTRNGEYLAVSHNKGMRTEVSVLAIEELVSVLSREGCMLGR